MNNKKIIKNALINSIAAAAYIAAVTALLANAQKLVGQEDTILSGIAFLLTFVLSAAVMSVVVFGKPILWYLDGFKKEAVKLIGYTLGFLFAILLVVFAIMIFLK